MNNEVLDDIRDDQFHNKKVKKRLILLSVVTVLLLLLFQILSRIIPVFFYKPLGVEVEIRVILLFIITFINSQLVPRILNKYKPQLSILKVVFGTAIILAGIELVFKIIQVFLYREFSLLNMVSSVVLFGLVGAFYSNYEIHKLRGKKTAIPNLLLILFIAAMLYYSKLVN